MAVFSLIYYSRTLLIFYSRVCSFLGGSIRSIYWMFWVGPILSSLWHCVGLHRCPTRVGRFRGHWHGADVKRGEFWPYRVSGRTPRVYHFEHGNIHHTLGLGVLGGPNDHAHCPDHQGNRQGNYQIEKWCIRATWLCMQTTVPTSNFVFFGCRFLVSRSLIYVFVCVALNWYLASAQKRTMHNPP